MLIIMFLLTRFIIDRCSKYHICVIVKSSIFNAELKCGIVRMMPFSVTNYITVILTILYSILLVLGIELIRSSALTHTEIMHDDRCQVSVTTLNGLRARDVS